ncbi:MAG: signal recognition particle protein [Planctomycetes bacterium]|nr:signal recognition particle protein [Planctomycetota bacterium]
MFDSLAQRFTRLFAGLGRSKLTPANIEDGVREVRTALLEADVGLDVVRGFVERVKEKAVGLTRLDGVAPADQFVKVVHDELVALLGGEETRIRWNDRGPTVFMMVGLQGTGKTTTCGKLALHLRRKEGKKPLLVAADVKRPAAIEQLKVIGRQVDVPVYAEEGGRPEKICARGVAKAIETGRDVVILDTAGRLHIDAELMDELEDVKGKTNPHEIWLVVDAQVGQDAVASAREFDRRLAVTGVVLSKTDGDARAGAALSIREVTGKPIRYVGTGEKLEQIEPFVPKRVAGRILGMGDVVGLVEKAQEVVDEASARETAEKMFRDAWTLDDFRLQLRQVREMSSKLGGLGGMLKHMPGMADLPEEVTGRMDDGQLVRWEAAIESMTPKERTDPVVLDGQRRARVARGSGTSVASVNELLKAFKLMRKQVKELKSKGILGRLAGRRMDKQKLKQIEDLKRRGIDLRNWFPES